MYGTIYGTHRRRHRHRQRRRRRFNLSFLQTWPAPEFVCNIAKFIVFAQFYSRFIPNFEMRAAPLRTLITGEYTDPIAQHWTPAAEDAWNNLK